MMDGDRDHLLWDPGEGKVEIKTGDREFEVRGLDEAVRFVSETPDGEAASALWLTPNQALVLTKMVRYIIDRVKIRPESKATLEELLPTLENVWPGQEG